MPKQRRSKRRVAQPTARAARTGGAGRSAPQQVNGVAQTVTVSVPKQMQMFPSRYRCWGTTSVVVQLSGTSDSSSFKMNSFNLFGPQSNFAGAFGSNVPAGLFYLLSASAAAGGNAPYNACTVLRQEVTVRALSNATNSSPSMIAIVHSPAATLSGLSATSLREQANTAWVDVPASTTNGAVVLRNNAWCSQIAGVTPAVYRSDEDYWFTSSADPTKLLYTHVLTRNLDGVSTLYMYLDIQFKTEFEFHTLNSFTSATP